MAGKVRLDHSSIWYCAAMPSMSCTEPWTAIPRSAFLTCLTSCRPKGGEMANEKVDVVIVGAGASGSVFAAVLTKAGKKVVILEQGPDWQLADLVSSDFWGRRIKPASGPFLLEGKTAARSIGRFPTRTLRHITIRSRRTSACPAMPRRRRFGGRRVRRIRWRR
ncbi:MAG: GMC family oxidoreductase [Alphaproteobacteria bacterium]|nr:MAG: GMC family oxidoreductase [Alphaproteobacteria bacterium]